MKLQLIKNDPGEGRSVIPLHDPPHRSKEHSRGITNFIHVI